MESYGISRSNSCRQSIKMIASDPIRNLPATDFDPEAFAEAYETTAAVHPCMHYRQHEPCPELSSALSIVSKVPTGVLIPLVNAGARVSGSSS